MDKDLQYKIKNYFPDMELIGRGDVDYGHNLAERILKENGSLINKNISQRNNVTQINEILNSNSPKSLRSSSKMRLLLQGILGKAVKAGLDIPYILENRKQIPTSELWNMYIRARKGYNIS